MSQWSDPSAYPPKNDCRGTSHSPAASPAGSYTGGKGNEVGVKRKLEAETCSETWHAGWNFKFTWPAHRETQSWRAGSLSGPS